MDCAYAQGTSCVQALTKSLRKSSVSGTPSISESPLQITPIKGSQRICFLEYCSSASSVAQRVHLPSQSNIKASTLLIRAFLSSSVARFAATQGGVRITKRTASSFSSGLFSSFRQGVLGSCKNLERREQLLPARRSQHSCLTQELLHFALRRLNSRPDFNAALIRVADCRRCSLDLSLRTGKLPRDPAISPAQGTFKNTRDPRGTEENNKQRCKALTLMELAISVHAGRRCEQ